MTNSPHYEDLPLKFTDDETNLNASEFNSRISNLDSRIYANENKLANIEPNATGDMTGKEIIDEINNEITTKINKNKLPSDVTYEDSLDVHNAHLNDRDNPHQVTKAQVLSGGNEIKNSDISQSANIHPSKLYHGANNQYGMNEITGIQTALDNKSNVGHTHSHNELTELNDDDHPHYLYTKPGARPAGQEHDGMFRDLDMRNNKILNVKRISFDNGKTLDPDGTILPVETDNITMIGDGASEKIKSIAKLGTYIAGEDVYKGDLVYQKPTDGMVYRTTTVNSVAKDINNIIGFAVDDVDVGLPIEVVQGDGSIYELPALTSIAKGKRYTISDAAGLMQVLQGDVYSLPLIGVGVSSTPPIIRITKDKPIVEPEKEYSGVIGFYKAGGTITSGAMTYQSKDDGLLYTANIMKNTALFSLIGIAIDDGGVDDVIRVLQGSGSIYEYEGEDWVEAGKPYTYDSGGLLVPYNPYNFFEPLVAVGINESTVRLMATVYSSGKEGGMAVYDNGTKNGTYEINWANGSWQKIMVDDDITLTFTKPSVMGTYRLDIYKGGDESITLDEYDLFTIDGESYEATESESGIAKDVLIFTFNGADFDLIASQNFRRVS